MKQHLIELRDAIAFGFASQADFEKNKREDVIAIKSDPEVVQFRFVASEDVAKAADTDARSVTWRASDETPDSYGDIVRVKGWDLGRFKQNGQILFGHDRHSPPLAVGKAWKSKAGQPDGALMVRGDWFDEGVNDFADGVLRIIQAGGLPGASVGFRAGDINDPDDPKEREKLGLGPWGLEFKTGHELLENSVVTIPANPNAMQERCMKALDVELERWLRDGQASPGFVSDFRKSVLAPTETVRERMRTTITVPEMPKQGSPTDQPDPQVEELRGDKARLARTVDHLLGEVLSLKGSNDQLRTQCEELETTVTELKASGAGQTQQPPSGERGAGAAETSSEHETDSSKTLAEIANGLRDFAKSLRPDKE